jgi:hypothetical protein
MHGSQFALSIAVALVAASTASQAIAGAPLISGLGGPAGFGDITQLPNDDQSSNNLNIPFTLNFFGNNYSSLFVNNNGNVSFGSPLGSYTPTAFPASSLPMIAPYWGDVDTRSQPGGGAVYIASPNPNTVVVTWNDVGFYSANNSKTNNFQLVLSNRPETGSGNFDIQFRYNRLEWTTGSASGGSNGLGGIPAQAGYDAGDFTNFFTLPGSRTAAVLDLQNTSNVSSSSPGIWQLFIRNGSITTGDTPETPLLPTVTNDDGFVFDFDIMLNQTIFIDPIISVGYDYVVNSGPNIASALFPLLPVEPGGYQLFGFNSMNGLYDISLGSVLPETVFNFGQGGVSRFGVRGIDVSAMLDPNNPTAFVTGLTFVEAGTVNITQTPFTVDTGAVPEPASWAMLIAGFGLVGAAARRRRTALVTA